MRYIGSKENLLGFLDSIVTAQGFTGGTFCDLFVRALLFSVGSRSYATP